MATTVWCQTKEEQARELGKQAIAQMDGGDVAGALELLDKAMKLDPKNPLYPYEVAYAHTLNKDYAKAIKVTKGLTKHKDAFDQVWQLLGNSYDYNGEPQKAISTYDEGLKRFPGSGCLHLERGNMELARKEYGKALEYYERGIDVAPTFPSNYYWAAKIFLGSDNEVWGMIYGELFMNLERNSKRTREMSQLLYETYRSEITILSDTARSVSFGKNHVIDPGRLTATGALALPYGMIYESAMAVAVAGVDSIDMNSLNDIRSRFVRFYFEQDHAKDYPNILFTFHKDLMDKGHFEAYNHWILMKGDEEAFGKWQGVNTEKWDDFVDWFTENPLRINAANKFHRSQF